MEKQYRLTLPAEVSRACDEAAREMGLNVEDLLRKFVRLGLVAAQIWRDPNAALLVREGEQVREITP